ncbi:universal stress protein [Halosolutus halophilus]|uniref:universal stress protein n=1 Tax=Halosolutus halophilus TaxID=1552990 RepID=UPI0022351C68|nr:universal stress protein [Halosolutus halophilus]
MFNDILVPTDGSDSSTAALNDALKIADRETTTVHFLHVIDVGTEMSAGASGMIAPEITETLEEEADTVLDDAVNRAEEAGVTYNRTIREGDPHDEIATYVADYDIDLIVMGASGRSGLKEHLLGSTSDRVIRTVETSVLLARP